MKKTFLTLTFILCSAFILNAQQLVSKKGIPILPQQGDIAIGVSATPFLDFVGNAAKINSTTAFSSSAAWNFLDPTQMYIYGKYFITDKTAIRGKIRIGMNSKSENAFPTKNGTTTNEQVEDKWTRTTTNIILAAGIEKRRGYGRLQGFYGAEAMISLMGGQKDSYEYGNEISSTYISPNRYDFNGNVVGPNFITEKKNGTVFGLGLNAFIGVEYFFAPKMSVGGEFGWGIGINQSSGVMGSGEVTYESWDAVKSVVKTETIETGGKVSTFSIDTKSTGGQIFLLFHF
jgi:hypothetical protein